MLSGGVRQHRLLERRERARLDDVGRDGAGEPGEDQRRQPAGEREHGARERHPDEQQPVAAAPADAVAVAGDQHRDERDPGQQGGEDDTDRRVGQAAIGKGDADQHRAEAVGERPRALRGDDPVSVRAQPRSASTSCLHHAYRAS